MQVNIPLKIIGLGRYLPKRIVPSSELEAMCGLSAGWVERHNGVRERRWVTDETSSFMSAEAAREALCEAKLRPDQLDLIINASGTGEQAIPDTGVLIQRQLGLGKSGIPAMTIHTTCLSFIMAMDVASNFISSGRYRNILIASADVASCGINPKEPESASLVGDAAAAVVVTRSGNGDKSMIHNAHFKSYGDGAYLTTIMGGGSRFHPRFEGHKAEDDLFHMDGPAVLRMVRGIAHDFLEEFYPGLSEGMVDIDVVVPHQASKVGLMMLKRFGWPENKIIKTIETLGNCVAASIPVTLYQGVRDGHIQRGDKILLVGTGAGLSIGGMVLTF
ncbi:3-oxoacyl-[acyl-carrier-protein] synthase III C-terminal domain-containing protein [Candidatus Villigracilis saccharophilus]|uniref:3-oxoacyl-[acyl-carrier-protein] synthase III C-terminal domain-containing protein n=1 Tax=Candidatus Villigracilis saccharophilus TaxID=3140684 RepID=UPI0031368742|nr:ketoacyl-ACP synthase III [Anaerolineales bacterium]